MLHGTLLRPGKRLARKLLQDELFISRHFRKTFDRPIDFFNPQTFNEKLQIQKLYNRDPRMTELADKYLVRGYVEGKGYGNILNPLIGVYDRAEDINFQELPDQFVIKCNHSSATNIICENKSTINEHETKAKLNKWMAESCYAKLREWSYKHIPRKLIVERYLGSNLKDYKFFCYSGIPKYVQVSSDRFGSHRLDLYSMDWEVIQCQKGGTKRSQNAEEQPSFFGEMVEIAKDLSSEFNFCRVDFLATSDSFYFGEITFYPAGGFDPFHPQDYDYEFGEPFDISNLKIPLISRIKIKAIQLLDKR